MIWEILGIEITKDKKKITEAYRKKLSVTNPEDKPEEFKQLRSAYEEALEYAGSEDKIEDETPVQIWGKKLENLYDDFSKRNNPECWKELLSDKVCQSLDSKPEAEKTLLNFFMSNYFIGHHIWTLLNEHFDWLARKNELYEDYPQGFIDYVIVDGINFTDLLPMDMFYPGTNGDDAKQYIELYKKARQDFEQAKDCFEQMDNLNESHPYGDVLKQCYRIKNGEMDGFDKIREILQQYPYDLTITDYLTNQLFSNGMYDKCIELCDDFSQHDEKCAKMKWMLVNCYEAKGMYREAVDVMGEIIPLADGDMVQLEMLAERRSDLNKKLIEQYEEQLKNNPDDNESKLLLAWCYLQNNLNDKAIELAGDFKLKDYEPFDFYNLMSNIVYVKDGGLKAIEYLWKLVEVIENLQDDGTKKTRRRISRKGEMLNRIATLYLEENQQQEAIDTYMRSYNENPSDGDTVSQICRSYLLMKDYANTETYARKLIEIRPDAYHGYLLLAIALFMQRYDKEALDAAERSIDLYGSDLEAYILEMRIYLRNNMYKEARQILDMFNESNVEHAPQVEYCRGYLKEFDESDKEGALQCYKNAFEQIEDIASVDLVGPTVYRYVCLLSEKMDAGKEKDRKKMMEVVNKGLQMEPDHYGLNDYKAWLCRCAGDYDEALQIYQKMMQNQNHDPNVEEEIGRIYYRGLEKGPNKALEFFLKSIERGGDSICWFYIGMCYMYLKQFDKSEEAFFKLQKERPDDVDSYIRLSQVYSAINENEKALQQAMLLDQLVKDSADDQSKRYYYVIRMLKRMGKKEETISYIKEAIARGNYAEGELELCKSYLFFGMYDEAKKLAHSGYARLKGKYKNDFAYLHTYSLILNEKIFQAQSDYLNLRSYYYQNDDRTLTIALGEIKQNYKQLAKGTFNVIKEKEKKNEDSTYEITRLAEQNYFAGNKADAQNYAQKAIEMYQQKLQEYSTCDALYLTKIANMQAISGQSDKAEETLEKVNGVPLCQNCCYGKCKDAFLVRVMIEIARGNYQEGYELAKKCRELFPDEADFISYISYLEKKVK